MSDLERKWTLLLKSINRELFTREGEAGPLPKCYMANRHRVHQLLAHTLLSLGQTRIVIQAPEKE